MRLGQSLIAASGILAAWPLLAQTQSYYAGSNVTGQLALVRTVNASQQAAGFQMLGAMIPTGKEVPPKILSKRLHPPVMSRMTALGALSAPSIAATQSLTVNPASAAFAFNGITHAQQRLSNGGNQFSIEPPSPGIAVGSGFILEGVNNAIQVYDTSGTPRLTAVLSSNQLFGLPPAINRSTGVYGPSPTDMRVFFDQAINRWFVLQRVQDNDTAGNLLPSSRLYLAVSQSGDPTGIYNIYEMDTTDAQNYFGCPCIADYPQIGADQYGFYISANEFNAYYPNFVDATILAISKASLAAGTAAPTAYRFIIPFSSGYEFAIQPATTPPGTSNFLGSGGLEYFISTQASYSSDSHVALWAMINTSSLGTANPSPVLTKALISTLPYTYPDVATQRPGPLPYGSSLSPAGQLAFLDGGDTRALSLTYAGGRLYLTFSTQDVDDNGKSVVSGAYAILSPTYRGGVLTATVIRQGHMTVNGNHVLRPAVAVNGQGRGAIVFTLVGPDYYPSSAFLPIDTFTTASTIQIAAMGTSPEDGFSGYFQPGMTGVARWGDYSTAFAASDGAIWMGAEYIPNLPRTQLANWGTSLIRYAP